MTDEQIRVLIRRIKLKLVKTSDNLNYLGRKNVLTNPHNNGRLSAKSNDVLDILCNPKSKLPNNSKELAEADNITTDGNGPPVALSSKTMVVRNTAESIDLISNAGVLYTPDEKDIPNEYEFEIIRLRRRVEELESVIRDRDQRNVKAIAMLEDELQMWSTLMHAHVSETHDGVQRRILRIESTLDSLKAKASKIYPPMEIPERWKKSDR